MFLYVFQLPENLIKMLTKITRKVRVGNIRFDFLMTGSIKMSVFWNLAHIAWHLVPMFYRNLLPSSSWHASKLGLRQKVPLKCWYLSNYTVSHPEKTL